MENKESTEIVLTLQVGNLTTGCKWPQKKWEETEDKQHALQVACNHMLATINQYVDQVKQ